VGACQKDARGSCLSCGSLTTGSACSSAELTMRERLYLSVLLASLAFGSGLWDQTKNPTTLVVRVSIGSYQNPAPANLSVQLQDGLGSTEQEGHTDTRGVVEFATFAALKRLRILGPGIIEQLETVEIEPVENRKMVNIIVKEDPRGSKISAAPGG